MEAANDLDALALQFGSDKFIGHSYTPIYDRYFSSLRGKPVELLEIGIGGYDDPNAGGASLRMWREYFSHGQIRGLDWYPKQGIAGDRIRTYQGSQADPRVIARIVEDTPAGAFDIVIDDGSHRSEHVVATFIMLFQFVAEGGWYVVEDTQTSYWSDFGGSSSEMNSGLSMMNFFKQLADGLNWREWHRPGYTPNYFDLNILTLHFYHNMIFIQKGRNEEPSNLVHGNRITSHT